MQEEHQEESTVTNKPSVNNSLLKDLSIPISIVIAGMFIGTGLYLGGGQSGDLSGQTVGNNVAAQAEPVDNTSKIDPISDTDHVKGNRNAQVKIVEFSDFDCPYCSRFHDVMNTIVEASEDVAWVYRHFPLEQLHPQAAAVAVSSECVGELGGNDAFWKFTDSYFTIRGTGDKSAHAVLIPKLVAEAGVSQEAFTECIDSGRHNESVQEDLDDAVETGGRGTPWSIIIGPSGKTYPLNGALPKQAIEQLIEVARQEA